MCHRHTAPADLFVRAWGAFVKCENANCICKPGCIQYVCAYSGYDCVHICCQSALRALHGWALRWLPAGLLGNLVSIALSCNKPRHALSHLSWFIVRLYLCVLLCVNVDSRTHELEAAWVTAHPVLHHKLLVNGDQSRSRSAARCFSLLLKSTQ